MATYFKHGNRNICMGSNLKFMRCFWNVNVACGAGGGAIAKTVEARKTIFRSISTRQWPCQQKNGILNLEPSLVSRQPIVASNLISFRTSVFFSFFRIAHMQRIKASTVAGWRTAITCYIYPCRNIVKAACRWGSLVSDRWWSTFYPKLERWSTCLVEGLAQKQTVQ